MIDIHRDTDREGERETKRRRERQTDRLRMTERKRDENIARNM